MNLKFILGINAKRKYPVLLVHGIKDPVFSITTAWNDLSKYKNKNHQVHLIGVDDLGHEWANKVNINDSIAVFINKNPLK